MPENSAMMKPRIIPWVVAGGLLLGLSGDTRQYWYYWGLRPSCRCRSGTAIAAAISIVDRTNRFDRFRTFGMKSRFVLSGSRLFWITSIVD